MSNPHWTFPLPGETKQPLVADANFGPVHFQDSIILEFSPTSYTGQIQLYCDWLNHTQGSGLPLADNLQTGSPLTYNFNALTPNSQDPDDYHACYFYFTNSASPNAQVFQLLNTPSTTPTTWRASGSGSSGSGAGSSSSSASSASASSSTTKSRTQTSSATNTASTALSSNTSSSETAAPSSSSSSSTASSTSQSTSQSSTTGAAAAATSSSTSASAVTSSSSSALSGGAIAGIVIGVLALIALLVGAGFFLGRRARRDRHVPTADAPPPMDYSGPGGAAAITGGGYGHGHGYEQSYGQKHGAYSQNVQRSEAPDTAYASWREKQGTYRGSNIGELASTGAGVAPWKTQRPNQNMSELEAARGHELHRDHRNELHA